MNDLAQNEWRSIVSDRSRSVNDHYMIGSENFRRSCAKFSTMTPNFLHVFGSAPGDLQLCFVQLKTLALFARYSTFKYPVTLKPGLGVTQGHQKL